jgi:hypothetical protein
MSETGFIANHALKARPTALHSLTGEGKDIVPETPPLESCWIGTCLRSASDQLWAGLHLLSGARVGSSRRMGLDDLFCAE